MLESNKNLYHSYQIKKECLFKVILKGIYPKTEHQEIDALVDKGHTNQYRLRI